MTQKISEISQINNNTTKQSTLLTSNYAPNKTNNFSFHNRTMSPFTPR